MSTSTTAAIPRERTRTRPKPPHRSVTHTILGLLVKLVVLVLLVIMIYPLFWLVTGSFKTQNEFITQPIWSLPSQLNWGNYTAAWTAGHMGIYLRNSILAVLPSLVLIVILGVAAGFALDVTIFRGRARRVPHRRRQRVQGRAGGGGRRHTSGALRDGLVSAAPGQERAGSSTIRLVPTPERLRTIKVPPTASTRSLRPTRPEPRAGSAPPTPSSLTESRTTPSTASTSTRTVEAFACLAALVSASETT
jgi:hypothetical protein